MNLSTPPSLPPFLFLLAFPSSRLLHSASHSQEEGKDKTLPKAKTKTSRPSRNTYPALFSPSRSSFHQEREKRETPIPRLHRRNLPRQVDAQPAHRIRSPPSQRSAPLDSVRLELTTAIILSIANMSDGRRAVESDKGLSLSSPLSCPRNAIASLPILIPLNELPPCAQPTTHLSNTCFS